MPKVNPYETPWSGGEKKQLSTTEKKNLCMQLVYVKNK
jgi:hypothetical protein